MDDIEWALEVPVKVTSMGYGAYLVAELNGTRKLGLTFLGTRLHFDREEHRDGALYGLSGSVRAANESPDGTAVLDER